MKTMFLTAFYAPILPIGIPISILGVSLAYWADKEYFLRRCITPFEMGKELSKIMTDYLEFFTFLFAAGNALMGLYIKQYSNDAATANGVLTVCLLGLILSILHLFVPTRSLHKQFIKKRHENPGPHEHSHTYEDLFLTFDTDYPR